MRDNLQCKETNETSEVCEDTKYDPIVGPEAESFLAGVFLEDIVSL